MEPELFDLVLDRRALAGQKARLNAMGDIAQPQIEAGGLNLRILDFDRRQNAVSGDQFADRLRGQNPRRMGGFRIRGGYLRRLFIHRPKLLPERQHT